MKIGYDKDLTPANTFKMKVSCACFVEYDSVRELEDFVCGGGLSVCPYPLLHIGGGSNLLFTKDFPGTVLHSGISFISASESVDEDGKVRVEVGAAVVWDDFCAWCAGRGLWGVENLSGIPGETGAAAVQNIGAYGVEAKDVVEKVKCFDIVLGREKVFSNADCQYGYRESLFKGTSKGRYIVTSVVFALSQTANPKLKYGHLEEAVAAEEGEMTPSLLRKTVIGMRDSKLPDPAVTGNAGSFFKNPVVPKSSFDVAANYARSKYGEGYVVPHFDAGSGFVKIPAAWLIEQCGWKGHTEGNVGVWHRQPLVLVNITGQAGPEEIMSLENRIIASVESLFGITLHPEVEHI